MSPESNKRAPTTRREKLEAREAAILSAAHSEFAEMGFEGAKMAAIARRASVAEGTVYLYYRNKAELLASVVAHFWDTLTEGARLAVPEGVTSLDQLHALARYHLDQLLNDFDFIDLTSQVRQKKNRHDESLQPIRHYVRVFDEIFQRGIDRGEFSPGSDCWQWRDLFFGQLEYSARTLLLRGTGDSEGVLDHLQRVLAAGLLSRARPAPAPSQGEDGLHQVVSDMRAQLDRIEELLSRPR